MEATNTAVEVEYIPECENYGFGNPYDPKYHGTWAVIFNDTYGSRFGYSTGFKTKEEAEGYLRGWNSHRAAISEKLFRSKFKNSSRYG